MPPLRFRINAAIHRAQTLRQSAGVRLTLPGVQFTAELPAAEGAAWRLLFLAMNQGELRHYWSANECCEGCVMTSAPAIRRVEALVRLTRAALGANASPVSKVLVSALADGLREFQDYLRGFTPDQVRHTPWGDGDRREYLRAMWILRSHLRAVLRQVSRLLEDSVGLPGMSERDATWPEEAYSALVDEQRQFDSFAPDDES